MYLRDKSKNDNEYIYIINNLFLSLALSPASYYTSTSHAWLENYDFVENTVFKRREKFFGAGEQGEINRYYGYTPTLNRVLNATTKKLSHPGSERIG